jgi:RNA polymerase sigma factor (TIGR02999 family)
VGDVNSAEITRLLAAWRRGDLAAPQHLFPLVYDELRALAHRQLGRPRRHGTLGTTALVHEAYLKLAGGAEVSLHDRGHFFALAATAMRQILVDYARRRAAAKRGGPEGRVAMPEIDQPGAITPDRSMELLALHEALAKLEDLEPRLGRVVELRVFGGLSIEEAAKVLDVSEGTVKRDWLKARAFLSLELGGARPKP